MRSLIVYMVIFLTCFTAIGGGQGDKKDDFSGKADCLFTKKVVDEDKGSSVMIMKREPLISYVAQESEQEKVDHSFVAYGHLAKYNDDLMLYLKLEILSPKAKEQYGNIYEGDKLLLKLDNDKVITLKSGKSEIGTSNGIVTSYSVFYAIPEDVVSKLKLDELTKLRIHWSNGYMDYEVNNTDFFIQQLLCME